MASRVHKSGPLQNRLRSKRNHFYAAFLALKCLPRTTPEHGVGVAPTPTRDVATTPLDFACDTRAKSNNTWTSAMHECMHAGSLNRFREMGEYRKSFGLRNCCSQRVGRMGEMFFFGVKFFNRWNSNELLKIFRFECEKCIEIRVEGDGWKYNNFSPMIIILKV